MDVLFACIREVAVNLLYSNPLLSLSRWKRYPCVNFFQATVNVSLAPLNSNPSEILESSSLKGSRREKQWSLLHQGGHKPWQPRHSPTPGTCQHSIAKNVCGRYTYWYQSGMKVKVGKTKQAKQVTASKSYGIIPGNDLPTPHTCTCIRWTASHLISLNPITYMYLQVKNQHFSY